MIAPSKTSDVSIWIKDMVEVGTELIGKSAADLSATHTLGIEGRLAYELIFFDETKNHLDVRNVTFCGDSRECDGSVPGVGWNKNRLGIFTCPFGEAIPRWRAREAIYL